PWTRMRRVYALLGLAKRYGDERVEQACTIALEVEMVDVTRLGRMLALGQLAAQTASPPPSNVIAIARYLRPVEQYALPLPPSRPAAHGTARRWPVMDPISPDPRTVMRRFELGRTRDTLPERLVPARQQKRPPQDFLLLVLGDEASRRDSITVTLRAQHAGLD